MGHMVGGVNLELPKQIDWNRHALFLDFDGTIVPIASRPQEVVISASTHLALLKIQSLSNGALALISGRALFDLEAHVAPMDCAMSGSHGAEIKSANGTTSSTGDAKELLALPLAALSAFGERHNLLVECKPCAVAIHYRDAPRLAEVSRSFVDKLSKASAGLRAMHGHLVSEVALSGLDKGTALKRIANDFPFKGRVPIMAGDDVTDEDAFKMVMALNGFGIKIGPGSSAAAYRMNNIREFLAWLYLQAGLP